jgi:hypothetical protein
MWISLFAIIIAVAICLGVTAVMMPPNQRQRIPTRSPFPSNRRRWALSKLTAEQAVREYNRGQKAAKDGRSRYWSEPSAYPFESDEHYQGRTDAFDQGYDDQFWLELKRKRLL